MHSHHPASIERRSCGSVSALSIATPSVTQQFVNAVTTPERGLDAVLDDAARFVREAGTRIIAQHALCPYEGYELGMQAIRHSFGGPSWPVTWISGNGWQGQITCGTQLHAVASDNLAPVLLDGAVVGYVFGDDDARQCILGNIGPRSTTASREVQARQVFERIEQALATWSAMPTSTRSGCGNTPKTGRIIGLVHKATGRETVAPTGSANRLELFWEKPSDMPAWDIGAIDHMEQLDSPVTLKVVESGPVRATVEFTRAFRESSLTQRVSLVDGGDALECELIVDWKETGNTAKDALWPLLRLAFDFDLESAAATYDVPFGSEGSLPDERSFVAFSPDSVTITGIA